MPSATNKAKDVNKTTSTKTVSGKRLSTKDKKTKIGLEMIELMEKSGLPVWRCPWIFGAPDMAYKGSTYNGVNAVILALARSALGFKSRLWLTHTKIEALNGRVWTPSKTGKCKGRWMKSSEPDNGSFAHIRKGSHGIPVVFWDWYDKKDIFGNVVLDSNGNPVKRAVLKTYVVHNADNVENFDPTPFEPKKEDTHIDVSSCIAVEQRLMESYEGGPRVIYGGDRACYRPLTDTISLPDPSQFRDVSEFASTMVHELAHSTGHETRLHRKIENKKGDDAYAREELVAEFTAAMVLGSLGIDTMPSVENSAAYLKSWLNHLKKTPDLLFDVITDARKAACLIMGEKNEAVGPDVEDDDEPSEKAAEAI